MITENQKNEIDNKYLPNGFFYVVKTFDVAKKTKRLNEPFESVELYEVAVKNVRHSNALYFFYKLKQLNEIDFIKEINNQYLNYILENEKNAGLWLSLTYDLVLKGFSVAGKIENITSRGLFIEWYDVRIAELALKHKATKEKLFSVFEWATIFYYADTTKLLPEKKQIKSKMEDFIKAHNVDTTLQNLKSKYYNVKTRINKKNDYPIDKLELILPFLKDNYNQTVTKVENDIEYLESEDNDY